MKLLLTRLLPILLVLHAAAALAQVPPETTYTGRLVDGGGTPLAGPVNLTLRVYDADTGGTQLYSEDHVGVALDATGGFSVQLGMGTSASGTFDESLFPSGERWLEVVVGSDVLTPRQIVGAVPWAFVAQQAYELVPDCPAGTHRVGAWCIGPTEPAVRWALAGQNCWNQGMQLCPLEALMACDILNPIGADCRTTTDAPATQWIWCSEFQGDDVNALGAFGGQGRAYAGNGNNTVNEADWIDVGQSHISHCCVAAPR